MANETKSASQETKVPTSSVPFKDMDVSQKLLFLGKVCVFLISGGFVFPTLFSD